MKLVIVHKATRNHHMLVGEFSFWGLVRSWGQLRMRYNQLTIIWK